IIWGSGSGGRMSDRQQGSVGGDARRRLRDHAGLFASGLAHLAVLLGIVLVGSPRLFATTPPPTIVVDIVRPDEIAKGELHQTARDAAEKARPHAPAAASPAATTADSATAGSAAAGRRTAAAFAPAIACQDGVRRAGFHLALSLAGEPARRRRAGGRLPDLRKHGQA